MYGVSSRESDFGETAGGKVRNPGQREERREIISHYAEKISNCKKYTGACGGAADHICGGGHGLCTLDQPDHTCHLGGHGKFHFSAGLYAE